MARMRTDTLTSEASFFRSPPPPRVADPEDLAETRAVPGARRRRRSAMNAFGWMSIAALSAVTAWMVTSTAARAPIESWGTMGMVAQPRLTVTSPEGAQREVLVPDGALTAQVVAPAPAEPSGAPAAATEPSVPAAPLRAGAPAHREAWRKKVDAMEDPYAGAVPRVPVPVADPYQEPEKARNVPYQPDDL